MLLYAESLYHDPLRMIHVLIFDGWFVHKVITARLHDAMSIFFVPSKWGWRVQCVSTGVVLYLYVDEKLAHTCCL